MNIVDLTYNPLKKKSRILINGNTVSPYGEIANYLLEPFAFWAPRILDALARELNDEFEMKFTSTSVETSIMEKLAQENESCTSFTSADFAINLNMADRISELEEVGYSSIDSTKLKIGVFSENEDVLTSVKSSFCKLGSAECVDNTVIVRYGRTLEITFVFLLSGVKLDGLAARCVVSNDKASLFEHLNRGEQNNLCVLVGENDEFCGMQQETLIFENKAHTLSVLLKDYVEYAFVVPFFVDELKAFLEQYSGDKDSYLIKVLDAVDPVIFVKCERNVLEEGDCCPITVSSFPESADIPEVIFRISNDNVVQYQNQRVYAVKAGNSLIEAYIAGTIEPIYQCNFTVIKRNKISDIQVTTASYILGKGDTAEIAYSVIPPNADNISNICIVSDNEDVVVVEPGELIRANNPGKATVKIYTPEVSREIGVEVKPYATRIALSSDVIKMLVGASRELSYRVVPDNAINDDVTFEVSDTKIIEYDGKNVKGKSFGIANIIFYNSDKTIRKQCDIEVKSTLANDKSNPFKALTVIAFIASLILSVFSKSVGLSCAAIGFILGLIGVPYEIAITDDQFTDFGQEKKPSLGWCIVGMVLNVIGIIVLLTR